MPRPRLSAGPGPGSRIASHVAFLRAAEHLKDTTRSGRTPGGRLQSVADHTWRLRLMAVALEDDLTGIDTCRLLRKLVGTIWAKRSGGDIPAPEQTSDKTADERADMAGLAALLPEAAGARLMALWDEHAAAWTPEARLAKGLDRIESLLHHVQGANGPDFDPTIWTTLATGWTPILRPAPCAIRSMPTPNVSPASGGSRIPGPHGRRRQEHSGRPRR